MAFESGEEQDGPSTFDVNSRVLRNKKIPKSKIDAEFGVPLSSFTMCFSRRCQPRGRTMSVEIFSLNL